MKHLTFEFNLALCFCHELYSLITCWLFHCHCRLHILSVTPTVKTFTHFQFKFIVTWQ